MASAKEILASIMRQPNVYQPSLSMSSDAHGVHNTVVPVRYPVLVPNAQGYAAAREAGGWSNGDDHQQTTTMSDDRQPTKTSNDHPHPHHLGEIAIFGAASESFSRKNINCSIQESLRRFQEVAKLALRDRVRIRGCVRVLCCAVVWCGAGWYGAGWCGVAWLSSHAPHAPYASPPLVDTCRACSGARTRATSSRKRWRTWPRSCLRSAATKSRSAIPSASGHRVRRTIHSPWHCAPPTTYSPTYVLPLTSSLLHPTDPFIDRSTLHPPRRRRPQARWKRSWSAWWRARFPWTSWPCTVTTPTVKRSPTSCAHCRFVAPGVGGLVVNRPCLLLGTFHLPLSTFLRLYRWMSLSHHPRSSPPSSLSPPYPPTPRVDGDPCGG